MTEEYEQQIKDEEHLKLLSLGYKVSAGITVFFSLFPLLYVLMGLMFLIVPPSQNGVEPPPAALGWIIAGFGLAFFAIGMTMAVLRWFTSQYIKQQRSLRFCQAVAALSCLEVPYGTLLGVLTFIVLSRKSVRQLFEDKNVNNA